MDADDVLVRFIMDGTSPSGEVSFRYPLQAVFGVEPSRLTATSKAKSRKESNHMKHQSSARGF
jgi:hypothetical protein